MTSTFDPGLQNDRRLEMMKVFQERLGDVSSNVWAILWLADLDKLQELLDTISDNRMLELLFCGFDVDSIAI